MTEFRSAAPGDSAAGGEIWGRRVTGAGVEVWSAGLNQAATFCAVEGGGAFHAGAGSAGDFEASPGLRLSLEIQGASLAWAVGNESGEPVRLTFPFLTVAFSATPDITVFGPQTFLDAYGRPIFRRADWPLPVARVAADGSTLTLLMDGFADVLSAGGLTLEPDARVGGEIVAHDGGWPAAFDLLRRHVRSQFDLSEYRRPELAWYGDQLVQHFTFLYGREILNHETGEFDVDRFLDEAERDFGGYDGFLIWGVYPRIGVDERTQWDFYDDLPGGRDGLRAMARRARERGVRFFVPYKPWDRSAELHGRGGRPDHEELARLIADVEADGVFLDTMSAIDRDFRRRIDDARPGVVFCSEGRARGPAFETITGAWDQTPTVSFNEGNWGAKPETMPGVDLWRFIFPEHRLFVVNRTAVGDDRISVTQRGFFSGMGWVVWQDIFGLVLTYSPEDAALLRKCRVLFRQHRQALNSPTPTPLLPTLRAGVYCNAFPAESKRLWTFYNAADSTVEGPVLRIQPRARTHLVDIWNERALTPDSDGCVSLNLPPRTLGAVVEFPTLLTYSVDASIRIVNPPEGANLEISQESFVWSGGPNDPPPALNRPYVARLVLGGEVLDQLIVAPDVRGGV